MFVSVILLCLFLAALCLFLFVCFDSLRPINNLSVVFICWDRADLLALLCVIIYCVYVTFPSVLGQVWHLIVSIPDLCLLPYFQYEKQINILFLSEGVL